MKWKVPRIWEGGDVWILGGGPSLLEQFQIPKNMIEPKQGEVSFSKIGKYFEPIYDKHVIGINVAYGLGNWIDICFFGDISFFLGHQKGLSEFKGLKVSCHPQTNKYEWVKYLEKDKSHEYGITLDPHKVSWNKNSGAAAISIAANAGAKRIILLGFDMDLGTDNNQHWHNVYAKRRIDKKTGLPTTPFARHLRGFGNIAADAKKRGIEIINASPNSKITQFRKVPVKDLL